MRCLCSIFFMRRGDSARNWAGDSGWEAGPVAAPSGPGEEGREEGGEEDGLPGSPPSPSCLSPSDAALDLVLDAGGSRFRVAGPAALGPRRPAGRFRPPSDLDDADSWPGSPRESAELVPALKGTSWAWPPSSGPSRTTEPMASGAPLPRWGSELGLRQGACFSRVGRVSHFQREGYVSGVARSPHTPLSPRFCSPVRRTVAGIPPPTYKDKPRQERRVR